MAEVCASNNTIIEADESSAFSSAEHSSFESRQNCQDETELVLRKAPSANTSLSKLSPSIAVSATATRGRSYRTLKVNDNPLATFIVREGSSGS